ALPIWYRTDPFNPDTDGDGLRDSYEVLTFHTDPIRPDTDLDGLSDGDESRNFLTDALKKDTDGDGLDDGEEIKTTKTNPLDADTDHGGVKDGIEVAKNVNPLDASDDRSVSLTGPSTTTDRTTPSTTPSTGRTMTDLNLGFMLAGIQFRTASDEITPGSTRILNRAYRVLTENPEVHLEIQGHTDNIGSAAVNLELSQRRAQAVKIWLIGRGIDPARLNTKGFGYSRPIASNDSESGRQKNRRIEFIVMR
ncbi:MAG: OmpA family protein, partial [Bacteroidetes bacterium]